MATRLHRDWHIALRCLAHPLSWLAIGILLINDHVLKHFVPSVLTGKLSDFAGLFFFPFLLAVILDFVNKRSDKIGRLAPIAFGMTALWFVAIKTWPWANTLMVTILSRLIGPVQIVRDPTDCIALLALWPAWRLWRRMGQTPPLQRPGKRAYIALAIASLATIATSCPSPPPQVERLVVAEDTIYANLNLGGPANWGGFYGYASALFSSTDGEHWQMIYANDLPEEVTRQLQKSPALPTTVCDPQTSQNCFRVTGNTVVQESKDGGQTWTIAWQIPNGRQYYIDRLQDSYIPCGGKSADSKMYDIALLPQAPDFLVIVARGNEGVLVRNVDGVWERYTVAAAQPTPFSGKVFLMLSELLFGLIATFLLWAITTFIAWYMLLSRSRHSAEYVQHSLFWVISPFLIGALLTGVIGGLGGMWLIATFGVWPLFLLPLIALSGVGLTWRRIRRVCPMKQAVKLAQIPCWLAPGGVFLSALPMLLWMLGTIAVY